jgi:hypothetical protein
MSILSWFGVALENVGKRLQERDSADVDRTNFRDPSHVLNHEGLRNFFEEAARKDLPPPLPDGIRPIWDRKNYTYPRDNIGEYQDLVGPIIAYTAEYDRTWTITISTAAGDSQGFLEGSSDYKEGTRLPRIGGQATIRIYDWGGGWYPDDRVMGYDTSTETLKKPA